ncbi:MAG: CHAT domain-containing protein [Myxococcaceae bacterium]
MIALAAVATVLSASPEAAYFRAWYPEPFADVAPESKVEETLRASVGLVHRGQIVEARAALAAFVANSEGEWRFVGALSQRQLEHLMARGLDGEFETTCLECDVAYVNQVGPDLDVSRLRPLLERLPQASQRRMVALKSLAESLRFLEEARSAEEFPAMAKPVFELVPLFNSVPEAQLVVSLVAARAAARAGNDGVTALRQGAAALTGCARAATLDDAAHLELGWAGHPLTLGAPVRDGRMLGLMQRSGKPVPPLFGPPPPSRPVLDEATASFAQCAAPWVKLEAALHAAILATRLGDPTAPARWLAVVTVARDANDARVADGASLVHALLTDNPQGATARLLAIEQRGDQAAFMSSVELVLLSSDLALAQGDVLRADVGWGALEAVFSASGRAVPWYATRALVAQRSAAAAFSLGLFARAVVDGERAVSAYSQASELCAALNERLGDDQEIARGFLENSCGVLKGDAFLAAEALSAAYRQATARGQVPAARADERLAAIEARREAWRRNLVWARETSPEPRKADVIDRINELQRLVSRELWVEGPTCAAWRRIEAKVGAEVRQPDAPGVPFATGLAFELDLRLSRCSDREWERARERVRRCSAAKARDELPRQADANPSLLISHAARAQAVIAQALALHELGVASEWTELFTQITAGLGAPVGALVPRAWVSLGNKRPEEALRLVSGAPPLDPAALPVRLEAWAQRGDPAQALVQFDALQAVGLMASERAAGVDRRNPFSAERAALEGEEARRGSLPPRDAARLEHLRRLPPMFAPTPSARFTTREEVETWASTLPAELTVLAFQPVGRTVVAWRIERTSGVKLFRVQLPPGFGDSVVGLERAARAGVADAEGPAIAVWSTLLKPLGPIADGRVVAITASMDFSGVLFEAAHAPGERPLALRVPVLRTQSIRELVRVEPRTGAAVAFGLGLGGLERAPAEARAVTQAVGGVLLPADASREEVLDALSRARWVHLATHGSIDQTNPLASTVRLARGESLRVYDFLSVAGGADGIVFSACDTSIAGFSAMAHAGGARFALATPWPIWDSEAAAMNGAYYGGLGADATLWVRRAPEALLAARRAGADAGMVEEAAATAFIASARSVESLFVP